MSVYTSGKDELCCPLCGDTNTHLDEVAVAARLLGEGGPVAEIGMDARGAVTNRASLVPVGRQVGTGRRHRFSLFGWCEACDGRFALVFTQHQGVTLVESVDLSLNVAEDAA